jgi:hypothetical protein
VQGRGVRAGCFGQFGYGARLTEMVGNT